MKFAIFVLNYRNGDNFDVAVAPSSKHKRPSVKIAYIRLRIDLFEEFAIDYNLTAYILIRYGQKYIVQWEINKNVNVSAQWNICTILTL